MRQAPVLYIQFRTFFAQRPYLRTLLVFSLFFIAFLSIYLPGTTLASSDDHFFHFRFAELMQTKGFFTSFSDFKSIYFSKMAEGSYFVYYNFLFYLCILPFTYITPLYLGIKLYAIVAASLVFTGIYIAAQQFRVRYAFWWVLALASLASIDSLWRLFLSRPFVLAPMFLVALIACIYKRKPILVGLVSLLYLYWYDASFFFPLLVTLLYAFVEKMYTDRFDFRYIAASALGMGIGLLSFLIIAPGFYGYMHDIIFGAVFSHSNIGFLEGGELRGLDIIAYAHANALFFAGLIVTLVAEAYFYLMFRDGGGSRSSETVRIATVRLTLIFTIFSCLAAATIVTGRFGDYLFPLISLYLILALSQAFSHIEIGTHAFKKSLIIGIIAAISYLGVTTFSSLDTYLANNGAPVEVFEGLGTWLHTHTPPGTIVFNANWSWFPQLYYYSPDDYYITGLEPRFLYVYNPRLLWLWVNATRLGAVCEDETCPQVAVAAYEVHQHPDTAFALAWYKKSGDALAKMFLNDFHSEYIVSSYQYVALNAVLDHNSHFKKVYGGDRTYYIYHVISTP